MTTAVTLLHADHGDDDDDDDDAGDDGRGDMWCCHGNFKKLHTSVT